jgi:hypothetical protein
LGQQSIGRRCPGLGRVVAIEAEFGWTNVLYFAG